MKMEKLSRILIRAFWLGILFLAAWTNLFIVWDIRLYASHAQWFHLSYHEFELIHYCGMIVLMLCLTTAFLLPYLAIKWYEHSKKNGD